MLRHETTIVRQTQRDAGFAPPYCPNQVCPQFHKLDQGFNRYGKISIDRFPYSSQRFLCKSCSKTFTCSYFRLDYRERIWGHYKTIFYLNRINTPKREISRFIKHSEYYVRQKISKMSRHALLFDAKMNEELKIREPIVYDGLENFSFSQFDPNNVNHAVGKNSLFTYDYNFCPLNRKGRMTRAQARKKKRLEEQFGPYPRGDIRTSTKRIFERLLKRTNELTLYTDEHFQYQRVVNWDLRAKPITHIKISSRKYRNFRNKLFAVNNIDMQVRHNYSAFKRETIAFAKHSIAMMESFTLNTLFRNYMRPKFWGTHRSDPESSKNSPAMQIGLTSKILTFEDVFNLRLEPAHVKLNHDHKNFYDRVDRTSRRVIKQAA